MCLYYIFMCHNSESVLPRLLLSAASWGFGSLLAEECIWQNEREFLNTLSSLIDQSTDLSGIIGF